MLGKEITITDNYLDSLNKLLQVVREKTTNCIDKDTIYLSAHSFSSEKLMKDIYKVIKIAGYKTIVQAKYNDVFYVAKWRFPDSCYIDENHIGEDSLIIEIVFQNRDTLHSPEKDLDVLIHERILMDDTKFNYWKWVLYVDDNYLGADGLMPTERITGKVVKQGNTRILDGYKDRYGMMLKTGVLRKMTFVKFETDHNLQEFWLNVETGNIFIRKNYNRKTKSGR